MTPLVSIILPTFNRIGMLPRAVESVLAQCYKEFELLVIDDGSTDDTHEYLLKLVKEDHRVRALFQASNQGVSAARNRGLINARGSYIAFIDSDDEWLPGKLGKQMKFLARNSQIGLLYGGTNTIGYQADAPQYRGEIHKILLEKNVIHGTSGVILTAEAREDTGFFDESLPAIEDWDYWIRLSRLYPVDFIEEPMIRYYASSTDAVRKTLNVRENLDARRLLYEKHRVALRSAGVADKFLAESARRHRLAGEAAQAAELLAGAIRLRPSHFEYYSAWAKLKLRSMLGRKGSSHPQFPPDSGFDGAAR